MTTAKKTVTKKAVKKAPVKKVAKKQEEEMMTIHSFFGATKVPKKKIARSMKDEVTDIKIEKGKVTVMQKEAEKVMSKIKKKPVKKSSVVTEGSKDLFSFASDRHEINSATNSEDPSLDSLYPTREKENIAKVKKFMETGGCTTTTARCRVRDIPLQVQIDLDKTMGAPLFSNLPGAIDEFKKEYDTSKKKKEEKKEESKRPLYETVDLIMFSRKLQEIVGKLSFDELLRARIDIGEDDGIQVVVPNKTAEGCIEALSKPEDRYIVTWKPMVKEEEYVDASTLARVLNRVKAKKGGLSEEEAMAYKSDVK